MSGACIFLAAVFKAIFGQFRSNEGLTQHGIGHTQSPTQPWKWRSSQVVRQWFAKPSFESSILSSASNFYQILTDRKYCIDQLRRWRRAKLKR